MKKIKLSEIREIKEYKKIVEFEISGETIEIGVLNPTGELFEELYTVVATLLEEDVAILEDGTEIVEDTLMPYFIDKLTDIEVDEFEKISLEDNLPFLEIIQTIQEIYSEMIIKAQIALTNFYYQEKQIYYANKLEETHNSFVEMRGKSLKEEEKEIEK